jgi:large subunit ribosomal protein L7/L12
LKLKLAACCPATAPLVVDQQRKVNDVMSDETAVMEYSEVSKKLGDQIAGLTLKEAKELSDYLKHTHGIEPAAGGAVVMAAASGGEGGGAAVAEKTEFDIVLTGFGDKKLDVVKVVKAITGASLMDAKKMVEACPATLKQAASKEEAAKIKADVEAAGGSVELK